MGKYSSISTVQLVNKFEELARKYSDTAGGISIEVGAELLAVRGELEKERGVPSNKLTALLSSIKNLASAERKRELARSEILSIYGKGHKA